MKPDPKSNLQNQAAYANFTSAWRRNIGLNPLFGIEIAEIQ
jgi:hypothetical protein